jgi:hypothetical protein
MEKKNCFNNNVPFKFAFFDWWISFVQQFKNEVILEIFKLPKVREKYYYNCQNPIFDFQCEAKNYIKSWLKDFG